MIWRYIRGLMAIVGAVMLFGGVSTSDYYVMELGTKEPPHVWVMIMSGLMLMLPAIIFSIYAESREDNE